MKQQDDNERSLGLSTAQVAGSALAATSSALVASWAGTTGTIIGAAVGSVVATIGAATYTWWLRRTSEAVRRRAAQVRQAALATQPLPRTVAEGPLRSDEDGESGAGPETQETPDRSLPWGKILLASAAVTVTALGGITTIEAITGEPISSLIGRDDAKGTSVGHLVGSDDDSGEQTPTNEPTPTPSESVSPTTEPSTTPEPSVPTPSVPTATPTTPEPTQPTDGPPLPQDSPGASTSP
jgi:hypothetical protein